MHTCVLRVKIYTAARACFSIRSGIHIEYSHAEYDIDGVRARDDISMYSATLSPYHQMVSKCQLSVLLPEGKRATKRQLYSEPFTLREAASCIFKKQW